ncbi:MAG: hypothetical protein ABEJ48_03820 [Halobacteriales archaeon]
MSSSEIAVIIGALLTGVAAFLPWVVAQAAPVDVGGKASGIEGLGLFTLVAGIVVGLIVLTDRGPRDSPFAIGIGLVVVLIGLWKLLDLGGPVGPGIGLYLTVIGGGIITIASGWSYTNSPDHSNGSVL